MSSATDLLEAKANLLFENVAGWETRTLERIGRRVKKRGRMTRNELKALNNMADAKKDAAAILEDLATVTGQNINQIEGIYTEVLSMQHESNRTLYDFKNKPFVPLENNESLKAIINAYSRTTAGEMFNLSMTKARQLGFMDADGKFTPIEKKINNVLDKAVMSVTTGSTDFNTAMRDVMVQLGTSGIKVHYDSGINRRLDTVVRQNLLWGAKQASIEYNNALSDELGCDGFEVDWHWNPRPSHVFLQGRQFANGKSVTIGGEFFQGADDNDPQSSSGKTANQALNDYGCLHFKAPIFLGISEPAYTSKQLTEMNAKNAKKLTVDGVLKTGYEWEQQMRIIETEIRKEKEIVAGLTAQGDLEGAKKHRQRIKALREKYDNICAQTGLESQTQHMRQFKI